MSEVENRMVNDSVWGNVDKFIENDKERFLSGSGYRDIESGIFVPEKSAYEYASDMVSWDDELKQEFVEWFFSGNWIKEE